MFELQAIYWVLTWACHRKCKHCYDDRFRPYVRDALTEVVGEGQTAFQKVIDNLPDDLSWVDETGVRDRTLLGLAGGELLIDGVREELFYPVLEALQSTLKERMVSDCGLSTARGFRLDTESNWLSSIGEEALPRQTTETLAEERGRAGQTDRRKTHSINAQVARFLSHGGS